jgi:hypothetical protein
MILAGHTRWWNSGCRKWPATDYSISVRVLHQLALRNDGDETEPVITFG